ncbi:MAG: hypothetical protein WCX79_00055 [Candidatus Paceibacterota bacterium]|jgi:hypothetical protein
MIHRAKSPDTTRYAFRGHIYSIYDAYENVQTAKASARDLGTQAGRTYPNNMTLAIVVDLGPEAGRLRYGVFVAKGARV